MSSSQPLSHNPYIHPAWHDIVPPIYSPTHPNQPHPYSNANGINLHRQYQQQPPSPPLLIPSPFVHPASQSNEDFPPLTSSTTPSPSSTSVICQTGPRGGTVIGDGQRQTLDRFASSYTPQWLKQLPQPPNQLNLPPSPPFPLPDYAADIFTPKLLSNPLPISQQCPSILSLPPSKDKPLPLQHGDTYAPHFSNLLSLHLSALVEDLSRASIPSTIIQPYSIQGLQDTFRIYVPGIREDSPRLYVGDRMIIRGLYQQMRQASSNEIEAEVVGLEKVKSWVYVQSPYLASLDGDRVRGGNGIANHPEDIDKVDQVGVRCQIRFLLNVKPVCDMQDAVRTLGLLHAIGWETVQRWLFPEVTHVGTEISDKSQIQLEWVDAGLNEQQRGAIGAVTSREHEVPYLISGPPGKTKTLVEAALQILATHPDSNILICAPSNSAADTIARRLCVPSSISSASGSINQPGTVLRLNLPSRTFAEVPGEILPFCYVAPTATGTNAFSIPPFAELMRYRVVICTCQDASILATANATNIAMMKAESEMLNTFHRVSGSSRIRDIPPHWTHLLIDEAAQASEPEALIPLSVVVPYPLPEGFRFVDPVIVLCGDIHQLGPIISSQEARDGELDVSLLERLFQREVYAAHSYDRSRQNLGDRHHTSDWEAPFTNLVQNYRSIAPILMVPAAMFYNDTLVPAAKNVDLLKWKDLPNPKIPILFQGCDGAEDWIDEGASWYNPREVKTTSRLVESLLGADLGIKQNQIAVITPWREQVWRIRARLRSMGFHEVDVGNVETYQGAEFRVTIVSCVRSRERFLDHDRKMNMGLFNERKRFNVAITRAKEILIVVGNANLLKRDPYWNGFLQIMLRNNLYKGPKLDLEMSGAYISRLESAMHRNEDHDPEQAVLRLAGALARETLRED